MASSAPVVEDVTATAAQYNALREDVLEVHDHSEINVVDHGDLSEVGGAIDGTYLTHGKLSKHVQGAGASLDPDDPGGSSGVHGLGADSFVLGTRDSAGKVFVVGTAATDDYIWPDIQTMIASIPFGVTFTDIPAIFICPWQVADNRACGWCLSYRHAAEFNVRFYVQDKREEATVHFTWIAYGVVA